MATRQPSSFPEVPPPLVAQLAERGLLVQPVGYGGNEDVVLFRKRDGALMRMRRVIGVDFVSLIGQHGFSR
jgi:protein-L-isoaspartate(D-aspartate) O-methyltransferase